MALYHMHAERAYQNGPNNLDPLPENNKATYWEVSSSWHTRLYFGGSDQQLTHTATYWDECTAAGILCYIILY